MKIKCSKCGKRFDLDVYSGICPKCGAYNGVHAEGSDISQYLSSGYSGEEAHRQLHKAYGDTGHDPDAHRKLHDTYDRSYGDAHPVYAGQTDGKLHPAGSAVKTARQKKSGYAAVIVLCFLLVLVPAITVYCYQQMKKEIIQERMNVEISQVTAENGNTIVFEQEPFVYPLTVSVAGQERIEPDEFAEEGKVLLVVKVSAASESYNRDAWIENVFLGYRYGGNDCYQKPMDFYSMSEINSWPFGLADSELLSPYSYGFGNGEREEGYWFFVIPQDAENPELIFETATGEGIVFSQGTISLENVPEMTF